MATFVQWLSTLTLLLVGIAFFVPGNIAGDASNLAPLFTNLEGFLRVVIMTPFLFLGFDVIPQVAEEIDVPFKAVGKLILFSILIAFGWYAIVQWTVGLTLGSASLADRALPTADAMAQIYGSPWGGRALVLGGLMGIITSWNAFFIGATRLLFALSRGGMLPAIFSRLHPRYKSPVAAVALVTCFSATAPFFGRQALVWLVDAGALAAVIGYLLVTVSFLRIRRKYPHLPRPYQAPAPIFTGIVAFTITLFFICLYLPGSPSALLWPHEWLIVLVWAALGLVFAVGRRRYATAMSEDEQTERILGDYARFLR
jgi:amino acid transporter